MESTLCNNYEKGDLVHGGRTVCTGILYIIKGKLRGYVLSEDGRDVTLNKLMEDSMCIMSGACIIDDLNRNFYIEATENAQILVIDVKYIKNFLKNIMKLKYSFWK